MFLQADQEFDLLAGIPEPLDVPFPDLETDQSSSHNVSSLHPRVQQSINELGDDLHVRWTAVHDHFMFEKPRDELIERIVRSPDGPAASQIPVISRHLECALALCLAPKE